MTILLADDEISELERQKKIVGCIAVICRVCGFRQHDSPYAVRPAHERCPNKCVLPIQEKQCRLCGDPIQSRHPKAYCKTHNYRNYYPSTTGCYATHIAETHWHAAEGAGPVSQYAVTS